MGYGSRTLELLQEYYEDRMPIVPLTEANQEGQSEGQSNATGEVSAHLIYHKCPFSFLAVVLFHCQFLNISSNFIQCKLLVNALLQTYHLTESLKFVCWLFVGRQRLCSVNKFRRKRIFHHFLLV